MAKLYLIAVPYDRRLQPAFLNKPPGLKEVVVEVLDFDDALALGPMELDDILSRMGESLTSIEAKMKEPPPPGPFPDGRDPASLARQKPLL